MNRRSFIMSTGALSALVVSGELFGKIRHGGSKLPATEDEIFASLERSIKAGFGAGFRLLEYKNQERGYVAEVEHLENHYIVKSINGIDWTIVSSDIV